jgi:hypothetical protein
MNEQTTSMPSHCAAKEKERYQYKAEYGLNGLLAEEHHRPAPE